MKAPDFPAPRWQRISLLLAGFYNIAWGALTVLFPLALFQLFGMQMPLYPELWQCIGMIVGVYGLGYLIAAYDPYRHWPIVLVGFLGKIFGPIGFAKALIEGTFPLGFGLNILTNDLIWWIPFGAVLLGAYQSWKKENAKGLKEQAESLKQVLRKTQLQGSQSLFEYSNQRKVLLVFLRHSGCTFCRETLAHLKKHRNTLEQAGVYPVLVHMGDEAAGEAFFSQYDLEDLPQISDPSSRLYQAFGFGRGDLGQMFGLNVWLRGFVAGVLKGHGVGALNGDGFQLSGYALLKNAQLLSAHVHKDAAERTDFVKIAKDFA